MLLRIGTSPCHPFTLSLIYKLKPVANCCYNPLDTYEGLFYVAFGATREDPRLGAAGACSDCGHEPAGRCAAGGRGVRALRLGRGAGDPRVYGAELRAALGEVGLLPAAARPGQRGGE